MDREIIPVIFYESPSGLLHINGEDETLCGIKVTDEWLDRDRPAYADHVCRRCRGIFQAGMEKSLQDDREARQWIKQE